MNVLKIQGSNNINFAHKVAEIRKGADFKTKASAASLAVILCAFKSGKVDKVGDNFIKTVQDIPYKNKLIEGLKKTGLECKIEDLKSIIGPDEFVELVKKFKPKHFNVGLQGVYFDRFSNAKEMDKFLVSSKENLENFYSNLAQGNFRVSLHTHTNLSDGIATVEEFMQSAVNYADKMAKKGVNDGLPPLTIAMTDHDSIEGCKKALELIVKNPSKYKNLKFVVGAELSSKSDLAVAGIKDYDLTAHTLNPFDEKLEKTLNNLKKAREKTVFNELKKYPKEDGTFYTIKDLIEQQKKTGDGKVDVQNLRSTSSVRHAIRAVGELLGKKGLSEECAIKDNLNMNDVISLIRENGGHISLTHPLKSFWKMPEESALLELKKRGIEGLEACHQYTPLEYYKLSRRNGDKDPTIIAKEIFEGLSDFARANDMYLSGGTDSHMKQIFIYRPIDKAVDNFVNNVLN